MGLPGHRRTSSHKRRRASHFALKKATLAKCAQCGAATLPHHACPSCGSYRGRTVARTTAPVAAKAVAHDHSDHEGHDHAEETKAAAPKKTRKKTEKKDASQG